MQMWTYIAVGLGGLFVLVVVGALTALFCAALYMGKVDDAVKHETGLPR
jgi:hypothetical protein